MKSSRVFRLLALAVISLAGAFAQGGAASPEALFKQIFTALESKDEAALTKLTIDQAEFKKFVWPGVGGSANNTNAEKYYAMYTRSSKVGIDDCLKAYGGHKVEVLKVALDPPRNHGKEYRLLPGAQVTLNDGGQEKTVHLLGGILEQGGQYKVASYYVRLSQPSAK